MQTILVTGFEPFGGDTVNPSWDVAQALAGRTIGAADAPRTVVAAVCLPCVFGAALDALEQALAEHRPTLVLALGQAAGRCDFSVERVAINVDDARIADNAGARPIDVPVVAGAPAAYFSTLPIKAIVAALRRAGLPASMSQTAGTFVCNHVFFGLMHRLREQRVVHGVRAGFMHLPLLPEQAAAMAARGGNSLCSLPLNTLIEGVQIALETALSTTADLHASGGTES